MLSLLSLPGDFLTKQFGLGRSLLVKSQATYWNINTNLKKEWHYRDLSFVPAWLMTPVTWTPISDPNSQIFSCSSEVLPRLAARSSMIGGANELSPSSSIAGRRFLPQGVQCCPAARGSLLPTSASWANGVPGSLKTNCCSNSVLIFHQS